MNFKKVIGVIFAIVATVTLTQENSFAQENLYHYAWKEHTIEKTKLDLQSTHNENMYVIKWGDTLYAIDLSITINQETLDNRKNTNHMQFVDVDYVLYLNNHKTITSVNTPSKEVIQQEQQTSMQLKEESMQSTSDAVTTKTLSESPRLYTLKQFMFNGVVNWKGLKFTYYSQSVLPGGGLDIPGRHVNESGYVADKDGYIVVANSSPMGTIIDTPFGYKGKVYDRGTTGNHYDVYIQ